MKPRNLEFTPRNRKRDRPFYVSTFKIHQIYERCYLFFTIKSYQFIITLRSYITYTKHTLYRSCVPRRSANSDRLNWPNRDVWWVCCTSRSARHFPIAKKLGWWCRFDRHSGLFRNHQTPIPLPYHSMETKWSSRTKSDSSSLSAGRTRPSKRNRSFSSSSMLSRCLAYRFKCNFHCVKTVEQ